MNKKTSNGKEVLTNINLKIKKGESLAIIGKNGAGKSTLLKIICDVIKPTTGSVEVNGKIGALLELGSGFHPEYTGRENIKMSAALAGLSKNEIKDKLNLMIDFADIGEYIDQPVKNYSSGMIVRLGFSVITITQPDLLITDEVLAVGDTDFQRKCISWIDNYMKEGGTLLLVSHSTYHVQKLCKHAIWIDQGEIKMYGDSFITSQEYQNYHEKINKSSNNTNHKEHLYQIEDFKIKNKNNKEINEINQNEDLIVYVSINNTKESIPGLLIEIKKGDYPIYTTISKNHQINDSNFNDNSKVYKIKFPNINLLPAVYTIKVNVMDTECLNVMNQSEKTIKVRYQTHEMGVAILKSQWK
ncbi:MAG: polysaccharide ABC transporter ATP-binding protein [Marinicellaceae bacterium]